jgi:hypothetical protein
MKKQTQLGLIALLLIVVLVGGFLYVNRPSAAVRRSLENLAQASTAHFRARLNLANSTSTTQLLGEEGTIDVDLTGAWAKEAGADSFVTDLALTTQTESVSVKIEGDVRLIGDKLYYQITKTPQAFPALVQLKDQWIVSERGGSPEADSAENFKAPTFTTVKRQGVETVDGVPSVHYVATASAETIVSFMDGLASVLGTSLSKEQIDKIKGNVAEATTVPVDLWVKRWGSELKQLRIELAVPGGNTVQFTLLIKDTNQPVAIETPADALTLPEFIQQRQSALAPAPTPAQ